MPSEIGSRGIRVPESIPFLLRDLIHDRTGIFFEDSRMDLLLEKLEPLARKREFDSFLDYYYALKFNEHAEWDEAWNALSVQETYFWREMPQVKALVEVIVPNWFVKNSLPFKIWCAACATGEEPFTIAMALAEAGLEDHNIQIVGSDASPAALEKAQRSIYRENSFRALPEPLRQKYFKRIPEGWKLSSDIQQRVRFTRANLLEQGDISPLARVQAIFCRNVFIYFSPHAIRQAVAMMGAKMASGAFLFVGASESLLRMTTDFDLQEVGGALAYVRL
jgi:chemotaxis protein methyltransferase CheR